MISKWDAKQESGKPIRWATAVVQRRRVNRSLLLLGCESAQQMADRQAAANLVPSLRRKYVQERAEAAAVANQKGG
jgi:hypothetical protein